MKQHYITTKKRKFNYIHTHTQSNVCINNNIIMW